MLQRTSDGGKQYVVRIKDLLKTEAAKRDRANDFREIWSVVVDPAGAVVISGPIAT